MHLNLNFLNTFLSIAEHKNFRRAADEIGRTQSAVSMQIRQLEDQIGIKLFTRSTRKVELTPEGEHLLQHAKRAMEELNLGLRLLKDAIDVRRGYFAMGCVPTIAATRLPRVISSFEREFPGVTISVGEFPANELIERLRNSEIELGIAPRIEGHLDLEFETIMQDEIFALIPQRFHRSGRQEITLEELSTLPIIMLSDTAALRNVLDTALAEKGLALQTRYEVRQVQTQIAMASEEIGAAIVPFCAIPLELNPRVHALRIAEPNLQRDMCVVTRKGHELQGAARRFSMFLRRMLGPGSA